MRLNKYYLDLVYRMFEQLRYFINNVKCSFRCCNKSEPESTPDTPAPYDENNIQNHRPSFFQDISAETPSINIKRVTIPEIPLNEGTPILKKRPKPITQ